MINRPRHTTTRRSMTIAAMTCRADRQVQHQGIGREWPLLAATLTNGHRVHFVAPSATCGYWGNAIRRHRLVDLPREAYDSGSLQCPDPDERTDSVEEPIGNLEEAVRMWQTILIRGDS